MKKPRMILFDYGHTLAWEPSQDYLKGNCRTIELAVENPLGITGERLHEISSRIYGELFAQLRPLDLETDGLKLDGCIFDTLKLKFDAPSTRSSWSAGGPQSPSSPWRGSRAFSTSVTRRA